ncbi:MAG: hypothetical protein H6994_04545 [Pseudomonadales bacterium]|nr:hypothetical protein [Pseudomonadales bacterium]
MPDNAAKREQPNTDSCRFSSRCPMYQTFRNDFGLRMFQTTYCNSANHAKCARFALASKGTMPPSDLLPNGRTLVAASKRES